MPEPAKAVRHLLVINPNTSASVTALLQHHMAAALGPGVKVQAVTARFGAPYIACEASYAVAGHATLDAWAAALALRPNEPPDSVLIGCFGDPGLVALRESAGAPVTGLAEAAFIAAAQHGRFAIVTGGARWAPMLQRLADQLGFGTALAGIHTVAPTGAELAADPAAARALLQQACTDAIQHFGADAVVLGGAGLAGMAAAVQAGVAVPVIDSVLAGARHAMALPGGAPTQPPGFTVAWTHLSPEMTALGR